TRILPLGSDWLYVKLYGGAAVLDETLVTVFPPLLEAAAASGALSRWFFIRYADPQVHLRVRVNGQPHRLRRDVLPIICDALNPVLSSGRIWKIQFDTYEREIERYGGPEATATAEDIFFADSEACLTILRESASDEGMDLRWRACLW